MQQDSHERRCLPRPQASRSVLKVTLRTSAERTAIVPGKLRMMVTLGIKTLRNNQLDSLTVYLHFRVCPAILAKLSIFL